MKYELSFIISPAIPETDHPSVNQEVLDYLKGIDVKVTREPYFMGRRKLAYPIAKQKHGFYVCLEFEAENSVGLKDLDTKLKHNNSLLRYLMIKLENRREGQTIDFAKMEEKDRARNKVKTSANKPRKAPIRRESPSSKKVKMEDKDKDKGKVNLEDIDKKLDEILAEPKVD